MTKTSTIFAPFAFLAAMVSAQTPAFEAVEIQPSKNPLPPVMRSTFLPGGRYQLRNANLVDLIRTAWSVEPEAVYGGPTWLATDRFDVVAKAAPTSTAAERALMLRTMLQDRFKLVVHNDQKPVTVFALTVNKRGAQFKAATGGDGACNTNVVAGTPPTVVATCQSITMIAFATQLRSLASGYLAAHPVVDATGLKGSYDIALQWTPPGADSITVFQAIEKLGLKLETAQRTLPVIAVDSVNRTPTDNAPDVSKKLPPGLTEFEAATIKLNKSGGTNRRIQPKPGGRVEVENAPLRDLMTFTWGFDPADQDRIVGLPKWAETDRIDIVAKTVVLPGDAPPPLDDVRIMIRALLIERFKIESHTEDRPVAVWSLTVSKRGLKLKEADPASRSGCKLSNTQFGPAGNTIPARQYTCTNTTMAKLAEVLHQLAPAYVDHTAVDKTELKGGYDFDIVWTQRGAGDQRREATQPGDASDPSGGITFFDAVEKLGLHLDGSQKFSLPVLVIDRIEHLSDEN